MNDMLVIKSDGFLKKITYFPADDGIVYDATTGETWRTNGVTIDGITFWVDKKGINMDDERGRLVRRFIAKRDFVREAEVSDQTIVLRGWKTSGLARRDVEHYLINSGAVNRKFLEACPYDEKLFGVPLDNIDDPFIDSGFVARYDGENLVIEGDSQRSPTIKIPMECNAALEVLSRERGILVNEKEIPLIFGVFDFGDVAGIVNWSRSMWERNMLFEKFEGEVIESERVLPYRRVRVGDRYYYYESPSSWKARFGDVYLVRTSREKMVAYGWVEEDFLAGAAEVFFGGGLWLFMPRLLTGQSPFAMRKMGRKVWRLYSVVTPEGVFTMDVKEKRLARNEPLTLEDGSLVAVHSIFDHTVPFRESSVQCSYSYDGTRINVIIDGIKMKMCAEDFYGIVRLEDFGIDTELLGEYGIVLGSHQ